MTTNKVTPAQGSLVIQPDDDYVLSNTIPNLHKSNTPDVHLVKPIFQHVEEIIERVTHDPHVAGFKNDEGKLKSLKDDDPQLFQYVGRISCKITTNVLRGADAHDTTILVLQILENFSWEDKVILTLAAFALTFADFWLLIRIYSENALKEAVVDAQSEAYRNQFAATNKFVAALSPTAGSVIEIANLPRMYLEDADLEQNQVLKNVQIAVYWIIRSVVAAATLITNLSCRRIDQCVTGIVKPKEHEKLEKSNDLIRTNLLKLYKLIAERRSMEIDNMSVLKILISSDPSVLSLYHGPTRSKVSLEYLRKQPVLLLISDLDIPEEDIRLVETVCAKMSMRTPQIVWIPVVDRSLAWTGEKQSRLVSLQSRMPWYSIHDPSIISDAAIKSFRNDWNFKSRPILVVLSPQGDVLNTNAFHMIRIWENQALDFTTAREVELWKQETWNLELLVDDIDPIIKQWIAVEYYIFLYGGKDLEWIRKFTRYASSIAKALKVELKMVYVGVNHNKGQVRRVHQIIMAENLSYSWEDPNLLHRFWARIDSMIFSKSKLRKPDDNGEDKILKEIVRLHSQDEWALLAKGSKILVQGPGDIVLMALKEVEKCRDFGDAPRIVDQFMEETAGAHPCREVVLPEAENVTTTTISCPDCGRMMQTFNFLMCCD